MKSTSEKTLARGRRAARVRKKVFGTAARPRMSVFRSLKHMYVQFIDDEKGMTLGSVSTRSPEFGKRVSVSTGSAEGAKALGEMAGELAVQLGITEVVFDRSGCRYHGRIKAVADGARSKDLKI